MCDLVSLFRYNCQVTAGLSSRETAPAQSKGSSFKGALQHILYGCQALLLNHSYAALLTWLRNRPKGAPLADLYRGWCAEDLCPGGLGRTRSGKMGV